MYLRLLVNQAKLGALLIIYGAMTLIVSPVNDETAMIVIPVAILIVIYVLERLGLVRIFGGMTLAAILICTSAATFVLILNSRFGTFEPAVYAALSVLVASLGFALIRAATYPIEAK